MEKETMSKKIVESIKSSHIAPDPRWRIESEKWLYWMAVIFCGVFAGILFSLVILQLVQFSHVRPMPGGGMGPGLVRGQFSFWYHTFPYIRLVLFLIFIALTIFIFKRTPKGYRYQTGYVFGAVVLGVLLLATIFHATSANKPVEDFMNRREPAFMGEYRQKQWEHPEKGFAAGKVNGIEEDEFTLVSPQGKELRVQTTDETTFYGKEKLEEGRLIFVEGEMNNGVFDARIVKVTEGRRGREQKKILPANPKPESMQTFSEPNVL